MNPLTTVRNWWHRPVLDRLDAIERNTRPATVEMVPPQFASVADAERSVRSALRAGPKPRGIR